MLTWREAKIQDSKIFFGHTSVMFCGLVFTLAASRGVITCNNCVAVALLSGFFTKHWLTKSRNASDHRFGFLNVGGGLVGIMKMAWEKESEFRTPEKYST